MQARTIKLEAYLAEEQVKKMSKKKKKTGVNIKERQSQ